MDTKLVFRVLESDGAMLGWVEGIGQILGDGCITPYAVEVRCARAGLPTTVSIHWTDVNVEYRAPIDTAAFPDGVSEGARIQLVLPPILVGVVPTDLPGVTVGEGTIERAEARRGAFVVETLAGSLRS